MRKAIRRPIESSSSANLPSARAALAGAARRAIARVRFEGLEGRRMMADTTFLSDLSASFAANGWGAYEKDRSNGEQFAGDGRTITLNGKAYAKGLGTHAASDLRFYLAGAYTRFQSDVGLDDEVGPGGSVVFQVYADGTKIFDSGLMTGSTATKAVDVDVTGKNELRLVVTDGGDGASYDHADWADAKLSNGAVEAPPPAASTFVSDLTPTAASNFWGPWEKDRSNGEQFAGDGRAITLNGKTYAKGIGTHAASDLRFNLAGGYTRFQSEVGLDDEVGSGGSVVFQVWADGVKIFDSGLMGGSTATKAVDVDVTGKNELRLVVTDGGDGASYDHADWADARLLSGTVVTPPPPPPPQATAGFVSDLTPTFSGNFWGPWEKDRSNGEQFAGDGRTITLNGKTYAKGIGTHAASDLRFNLAGGYTRFQSDVGLDDEVGSGGSVAFQVWADGVKIFDSGLMGGSTATKAVDVDVTGKNELRLVVTDGGDGASYDHADWADAKLLTGLVTPPANQAPTANADSAQTSKNVAATINVLGNDVDSDGTLVPSSVAISTQPAHGSVSINPGTGAITYTPAGGYVGADEFWYTVKDDDGAATGPAKVSLNVVNPASTPTAFVASIGVNVGMHARTAKVVEKAINFTQLIGQGGGSGALIENSIRVVEVDGSGNVIDPSVTFQFDKAGGYNAANNALGTLVFLVGGNTAANATRQFKVTFATAGSFSAVTFGDQVVTTDNVTDAGSASFRVVTGAADYFVQKNNGGLSTILDKSGVDWLNFNPASGTQSGGEFRGLPNAGPDGNLHAGFNKGNTVLVSDGPLKTTLRSTVQVNTRGDGVLKTFVVRYDFLPTHMRATFEQAGDNYWFLYEGTPGGSVDANDSAVFSDGTSIASLPAATEASAAALDRAIGTGNGEEWAYFRDSAANKFLYLTHDQPDNVIDAYFTQNFNGSMTVFGFGRDQGAPGLSGLGLTGTHSFTVGLANGGSTSSAAAGVIRNANQPVTVTLGSGTALS